MTKDFGSPEVPTKKVDFKLFEQKFECKPAVQGTTLLEYSVKFGSTDDAVVNQAFLDFFKTALTEESYKDMKALWDDDEKIVPIETLGDIMGYLIEEYTDRPTSASEGS